MTPSEDFIHFLWKHKAFDIRNIQTTDGRPIEILNVGIHNMDAGPDFSNAKIRIDHTLWVGNVEIHRTASDWYLHKHELDPAYNNTILHVVWEEDTSCITEAGRKLDSVVLSDYCDESLLQKYTYLQTHHGWVPCEKVITSVPDVYKTGMVYRAAVQRLERKSTELIQELDASKGDVENVQYQWLMKSFGFKVNALPMQQLAKRIHPTLVRRYAQDLIKLEALYFGVAGFLEAVITDEKYIVLLKREFEHLKSLHNLKPMKRYEWKFMRTRPQNFPTVRLSQWCALVFASKGMPDILHLSKRPSELLSLLDIEVSAYWKVHFDFNKPWPKQKQGRLGQASKSVIAINAFATFYFSYGLYQANDQFKEAALNLLEELPAEDNAIIRKWSDLGLSFDTAQESQGALELKNEFCNRKKCVICSIGNFIFTNLQDIG